MTLVQTAVKGFVEYHKIETIFERVEDTVFAQREEVA